MMLPRNIAHKAEIQKFIENNKITNACVGGDFKNWLKSDAPSRRSFFFDFYQDEENKEVLKDEYAQAVMMPFPKVYWFEPPKPKLDSEQEDYILGLLDKWRKETGHLSSVEKIAMHPAYQTIISKGEAVLPILLKELKAKHDHLFWALRVITDENPVDDGDAGDIEKMVNAWVNWGRKKGHI